MVANDFIDHEVFFRCVDIQLLTASSILSFLSSLCVSVVCVVTAGCERRLRLLEIPRGDVNPVLVETGK